MFMCPLCVLVCGRLFRSLFVISTRLLDFLFSSSPHYCIRLCLQAIRELLQTVGSYRRKLRHLFGGQRKATTPTAGLSAKLSPPRDHHPPSITRLMLLELLLKDDIVRLLVWWNLPIRWGCLTKKPQFKSHLKELRLTALQRGPRVGEGSSNAAVVKTRQRTVVAPNAGEGFEAHREVVAVSDRNGLQKQQQRRASTECDTTLPRRQLEWRQLTLPSPLSSQPTSQQLPVQQILPHESTDYEQTAEDNAAMSLRSPDTSDTDAEQLSEADANAVALSSRRRSFPLSSDEFFLRSTKQQLDQLVAADDAVCPSPSSSFLLSDFGHSTLGGDDEMPSADSDQESVTQRDVVTPSGRPPPLRRIAGEHVDDIDSFVDEDNATGNDRTHPKLKPTFHDISDFWIVRRNGSGSSSRVGNERHLHSRLTIPSVTNSPNSLSDQSESEASRRRGRQSSVRNTTLQGSRRIISMGRKSDRRRFPWWRAKSGRRPVLRRKRRSKKPESVRFDDRGRLRSGSNNFTRIVHRDTVTSGSSWFDKPKQTVQEARLKVRRKGKLLLRSLPFASPKWQLWKYILTTSWSISPPLISQLLERFPARQTLRKVLRSVHVKNFPMSLLCILIAPQLNCHILDVVCTPNVITALGQSSADERFRTMKPILTQKLSFWCGCGKSSITAVRSTHSRRSSEALIPFPLLHLPIMPIKFVLSLIHRCHEYHILARRLALRSFEYQSVETCKLYLLQLIQGLRVDPGRIIESFLIDLAEAYPSIHDLLVYPLSTELFVSYKRTGRGNQINA